MMNLRVAIETVESSLFRELSPKNPFVIKYILLYIANFRPTSNDIGWSSYRGPYDG
jgi:hypothetical protein